MPKCTAMVRKLSSTRDTIERVGVEYLTTYGDGDYFVLYLRDKEIKRPEDLKGLKIRVTPIYRALFTSFGAEVISSPIAELSTMLERGVVDGYGFSSLSIRDNGWAKYTKYRIEPGFYTPNNAIIMNLAKWRSLSQDTRDFLKKKAIQLATEYPTRFGQAGTSRARQQVIEDGVKIITFEPSELRNVGLRPLTARRGRKSIGSIPSTALSFGS